MTPRRNVNQDAVNSNPTNKYKTKLVKTLQNIRDNGGIDDLKYK